MASALPLAIVKDAQQASGWSIVAVCGHAAGSNAMADGGGKWLAKVVPESVRYLPFTLRVISEGKGIAAIDPRYAKHVLALGTDGVPLFGQDGQLHEAARQRVAFLQDHQAKISRTQGILSAMDEAGLIAPWPEAAIKAGGIALEGLHTIDEKALRALGDDAFLGLRKSGALTVAYSCLLSLYQVRTLASPPDAAGATADGISTTGDLDLEFLNDSGTIKFGPLH